jgi:SulP family sulfate permease
VVNLVKIKPIIHAWHAEPHDGVVAVITFALTLFFAPHLEEGILIGVLLSLVLFLFRSMRPRVAELSRFHDNTMRDVSVHDLETSPKIALFRFDGDLFFANAGYFENQILQMVADKPELRFIILDAEGINAIDATGEEVLSNTIERLHAQNIEFVVARMKKQFIDALRRTHLYEAMGENSFYSRVTYALDYVWDSLGDSYDRTTCPLRRH